MTRLKDELIGAYSKAVNKRDAFLTNFKDGVADAILKGNMAEEYSDGYKAGYDFGITIYSRAVEMADKIKEKSNE